MKQSKVDEANAAVEAARAQAAVTRVGIREAGKVGLLSELKAESDSVVLAAPAEAGVLVGPSEGPLFILAETLDRLVLAAEVSELDVAAIQPGQSAEISVDALPGEHFPGKVVAVGLTPSRTGSLVNYPVTFELENPGRRLRPGLSATARVEADKAPDALSVPEAALRFLLPDAPPADDRTRIFRIGPNGEPESVSIKPGLTDGAFTEVKPDDAGPALAVGDQIVIGMATGKEKAAAGINLAGPKK